MIQLIIKYEVHYRLSNNAGPYTIAMFYGATPYRLQHWTNAKGDLLLKPEVELWLKERGYEHDLVMDTNGEICLEFKDSEAALMFKLTWL